MMTRRELLKNTAVAGSAMALVPQLLRAQSGDAIIRRAIPKTGEELPMIGLGSSATFSSLARNEDAAALREVLRALIDNGGTVFDTAPGYGGGSAEQVAGELVNELGVADEIFWATKVNVVSRRSSNPNADPAAARAQIERSFDIIQRPVIDLIQVHNLGDVPTQLGILKELKEEGRIRYLGVTWTGSRRFEDLAEVMRNEPLDFIGIDYAIDNRVAADMMLPLAQDLGIATLIYLPFGRSRLWSRVQWPGAAGLGRGDRREYLGAVLPEVHRGTPGGDGHHTEYEQAREHDRQSGWRSWAAARRGHAAAHGGACGRSALRLGRLPARE